MVLDLPPPVLSQVFWLDNPVTVAEQIAIDLLKDSTLG
jgi:hypothetical protein